MSTLAVLWAEDSSLVTGSPIEVYYDTRQRHSTWAMQQPAADQDSFSQQFELDDGTYDVTILCMTGPDSGELEIFIDAVSQFTVDLYSDEQTFNVLAVDTGVVVGNGNHTLTTVVTDVGNGAACRLTRIAFTPQ